MIIVKQIYVLAILVILSEINALRSEEVVVSINNKHIKVFRRLYFFSV